MKQKMQEKNIADDFLYDDLDEQTLLEIENDIASQEENEDEENQKQNQEDYKSIVADDSVKIYLQQIGKIN